VYESSKELVFWIKSALEIVLHCIQNSEIYLPWQADMSAMASAGVGDWYLSLFTY